MAITANCVYFWHMPHYQTPGWKPPDTYVIIWIPKATLAALGMVDWEAVSWRYLRNRYLRNRYLRNRYLRNRYLRNRYLRNRYPRNRYLRNRYPRNRYLRNRYPRNRYLRNRYLRNCYLRNRYLRNRYLRNRSLQEDECPLIRCLFVGSILLKWHTGRADSLGPGGEMPGGGGCPGGMPGGEEIC